MPNHTYERLLQLFEKEPRRALSANELGRLLGEEEGTIRVAITDLRRNGHNVRNKRSVGFWLEDGPAPPMGPPGNSGDDRWQGEPPNG